MTTATTQPDLMDEEDEAPALVPDSPDLFPLVDRIMRAQAFREQAIANLQLVSLGADFIRTMLVHEPLEDEKILAAVTDCAETWGRAMAQYEAFGSLISARGSA